jgi:hypothetical protein
MSSGRLTRRIAIGASAGLVAMGAVIGCSPTTEKDAPATPSATPNSSAPSSPATLSPTEKAIGPSGENSYSPKPVRPTPPGSVCQKVENGVCVR